MSNNVYIIVVKTGVAEQCGRPQNWDSGIADSGMTAIVMSFYIC